MTFKGVFAFLRPFHNGTHHFHVCALQNGKYLIVALYEFLIVRDDFKFLVAHGLGNRINLIPYGSLAFPGLRLCLLLSRHLLFRIL